MPAWVLGGVCPPVVLNIYVANGPWLQKVIAAVDLA